VANLTTKTLTEDDPVVPYQAAANGGDEFDANAGVGLVIENTAGGARQITIASEVTGAQKGTTADDWVLNVPDTEIWHVLPDSGRWDAFRNSVSGRAAITYDNEVGLRVAAVKR
jgi:hypothetical protein